MDHFLNDQLTEKFGFELSDSSTQQITDILHADDLPNTDFRQQIELKFNKSKANLNYVFPRKPFREDDSESLESLEDKGLCDLSKQLSKSKPIYKCRLKTEANEKNDYRQSGFQFKSPLSSSSEENALIKKCKTTQETRDDSSKQYHSILDDLEKNLYLANMKELQQNEGKQRQLQKQQKKIQAIHSRQPTSQGHYKYTSNNSNSMTHYNSNQQNYVSQKNKLMTHMSNIEINPVQNGCSNQSKNLLSKVYLKPNSNQMQSKVRRSQKNNLTQQSVNQEYLISILNNNQQKTDQQQQQHKLKAKQNDVQNPIFNVTNSNINLNVNINNNAPKKELLERTMAVAEFLRGQRVTKGVVQPRPNSQKEQRKSQRCQTDPMEIQGLAKKKLTQQQSTLNSSSLDKTSKNKKKTPLPHKNQRCNTVMDDYLQTELIKQIKFEYEKYFQQLKKKHKAHPNMPKDKYKNLSINIDPGI